MEKREFLFISNNYPFLSIICVNWLNFGHRQQLRVVTHSLSLNRRTVAEHGECCWKMCAKFGLQRRCEVTPTWRKTQASLSTSHPVGFSMPLTLRAMRKASSNSVYLMMVAVTSIVSSFPVSFLIELVTAYYYSSS